MKIKKIISLLFIAANLFFYSSASAATPISYGQTLSGSIDTIAEKDEFTFNGSSGNVITIRFAKTTGNFSPYVELFNPQGILIGSSIMGYLDVTLSSTGNFKFTIRDFGNINTGSYNVSIQCVNNPSGATTFNFGQTTSGNIDSFAKIATYQFSANANDKVYIAFVMLNQSSGSFNPNLELYSSTGVKLASSITGLLTATVPAAGNPSILVTDFGYNGTGIYELTLQRPNNPANVKNLIYNTLIEDSLEVVTGVNVYNFNADTNDTITLCSSVKTSTSGSFNAYLELFNSTGSLLKSGLGNLKHTFTAGGTFYLFITDFSRDGTGIYRLKLLSGDIFCSSIDFIEPQVSLIAPAGGEVIESGSPYTISWTSSDNVGIAAQEIRLSTDGGVTYPTVIASGLASSVQNFNWPVPADLSTNRARIKIICLDAAGNTGYDESSSDFSVLKTALPLDARNIGYEYDKLNRLTRSVSDGGIENNYAYDGLGNRLTLDTTADQPPSADFDHDGDVDWGDFAVFAASWLKRTGEPGYDPRCDFNHDGIVNFIDYATFANAWNPNPPAGLGAGAVSYSQIDLSWQDNSDGESGFKIERKMGAEGTYGQIAAVGQNVTTYSDTGLLAEQTYDYRVRAYGTTFGSTTSDYSNQASATTPPSNRSPILGSIANKTVNEGSPLQFTLLATDPDKDKLTYNAKTLPAGAALDSLSGKFSWTPGYNQAGKYKVTFTVSDGQLTDSEIIIIEVYGKPFLSYSYPRSGGPGTYLGIIGKDFGSRNSFSRVEFSGPGQSRQIQMDAQLIRWSDRYIICRVPKIKPGGYQFTVINQAGESKFRLFTVK